MKTPLSVIFSALLASASPTHGEDFMQGETLVHEVKNTVGQCLSSSKESIQDTLYKNLSQILQDPWLSSLTGDVLSSFHDSRQELFMLVNTTVEQSVYEMQTKAQNKGFVQLSQEHWQELRDIAEDETREWKERLIALIRLISIVNFFTLLPTVYGMTIYNAYKKRKTPSVLFWWFAISNALGTAGLFLAQTPLEWAGYSIATIAAIITFFLIRHGEKTNLLDEAFMEHMQEHTAFSIYDIEGKALQFSPKLLSILGTTEEEVFAYQKKHGEIITFFYPDIEERGRIDAYQSELKEWGQAYEATFFPRRVDNKKKLALHFNTIPRKNKKGEVIGSYRFAEDVTRDQRDNIDLLTGESDKYGFEKRFYDIVRIKKQRETEIEKKWILSIVYSDLDGFKKANDIYSHRNADVVLKEFTKMARKYFRSDDTVARLGWDEFWFICDTCDKGVALEKLNLLRDELSRTTFEIISGVLIDGGIRIATSRQESLEYEKKRNLEIKQDMETRKLIYDPQIHCCIGGMGISAGVTDFEYWKISLREENIPDFFTNLEQQCERVMSWAKKLDVLGVGIAKGKNAVGMTILDDKWQVLGSKMYSGERQKAFELNRMNIQDELACISRAVEVSIQNR